VTGIKMCNRSVLIYMWYYLFITLNLFHAECNSNYYYNNNNLMYTILLRCYADKLGICYSWRTHLWPISCTRWAYTRVAVHTVHSVVIVGNLQVLGTNQFNPSSMLDDRKSKLGR
jgi:hypothetical protein